MKAVRDRRRLMNAVCEAIHRLKAVREARSDGS